ncbi:MAG TPA: type II secretion system protein [Candidatus Sumerlaeota bacterium]|nr:type II secretion system protein [Candidatus Sumerlaeota bacterium]HON49731.1 type II secretion system protein [Candidatus Sumerlaeota bacterium]HOR64021.1 type II secretion system protein [Candidatus Sumerlaeota bacterium]HPL75241.1 type II secretion system protein [Candidatus Sumerlaeota bacterium]HQH11678.1 type II secretion system protein [Candidatus Sumerlaeota bacterium]
MKIRKIITSHKYGFTLVEIVIVAALVALFSGLATFGIQQMLRNNKLKAVIGEARQVGSSLIFAHQDIGFYPSIGFLNMSKAVIDGRFGMNGWRSLSPMGMPLGGISYTNAQKFWSGPYFAQSLSRNQTSVRFKSVVTMQVPIYTSGSSSPAGYEDIDWPADQWGNPYVLYLFKYDAVNRTWAFVDGPTDDANYWAAVVSYGPNGIPGTLHESEDFETFRTTRCLYHQDAIRTPIFRSLLITEYNTARAAVLDRAAPYIGIINPGSDDLIYNIE